MFRKIIQLSLLLVILPGLASCGGSGGNSSLPPVDAPYQVGYVNDNVYASIRAASASADALFATMDAIAGSDKCEVQILRMSYDTVGGAGEATTSSGVIMLPKGTDANCSGKRPALLYAHGTADDTRYDLSQFIADSSNPASSESILLLALYASRGYIVIAPNYAGYADSTLGYHPYLDETQQTTEMMDALGHARQYSADIGMKMSADLFVSGLSQGGYVAMATHKALQANGELVRASVPISGPYATLNFVDTIMAGYVNAGATVFSPMILTALEKSHDIYAKPAELYSPTFAANAENSLPRVGGYDDAVATNILPATAIFAGPPPTLNPPLQDFQKMGYGTPHLLSSAFRNSYLTDLLTNGNTPKYQIRSLIKDADLRDWVPMSPVLMCGSQYDPVVYFSNTNDMATYWNGLPTSLALNLDVTPTTAPLNNFALITQQWQAALGGGIISGADIHGQTGVYCGFAAYGFFQSQRTQ